jgi:hypothetical protein
MARPDLSPPTGRHRKPSHRGYRVNLRFIDWIWHVRGSLALAPGQTGDEAFDRLDPLFRQSGTSHQRTGDTLTFQKKDQAAQDRMSVFDGGVLRIDKGGAVLRYHLTSRALLFCFLASFLFLGIAQFTIVINKFEKPPPAPAKKDAVRPMNPIDKMLGAPAPEDPKKAKSKKDDEEGGGKRSKKPSPKPAYVFEGIFAALYVGGRILEDRLVKRLFRKALDGGLNEAGSPRAEQALRGAA